MSQLEVNKIVPQSGTSLTYGDNGDTFQIPSGVTLDIASGGTIDATGATITGFDAASDEKVKISSNDTTPGFLNGKLTAGANITLTEGSDGGDETLSIALSGTIPDARFPATLPAASGVNLTALNASNLGSGTVPTARLGSGTASSSTFLAGDQTFKTVTGTTINNNANNRLITGSGTANTLEGEADLTFDGTNLDLPDDKKIRLGASNDLEIYHDGTHSYISDQGTGNLKLLAANFVVSNAANNQTIMSGVAGGKVELNYNNVTKLETTSGGATVTGTLTADGVSLGDNENINLGAGNDLQIYHDSGTNKSYIKESGSADLVIAGNDILFRNTADDETMAYFQHDGAVTLKHNHVTKFATTADGIEVTGAVKSASDLTIGKTSGALMTAGGDAFVPTSSNSFDLGSTSAVWRNIYTSDLNMSNEGLDKGNDVDGTKGSWTFQEGADDLFLLNNKNGKKYKFKLEECK